jgi:tetratricopeptide (TPR) repeat protein
VEEGLENLRAFAADEKTPAWLYWGWLADVFWAGRLPDRVIECLEKAAEHAPDNPTVLTDLAAAYLRWDRGPGRARPLLERARRQEISDIVEPIVTGTEGHLALAEGRPDRAVELLHRALDGIRPFRHATPLIGPQVDRIHTYLCLAYAAAGDRGAAVRHFRLAEPRLVALKQDDLLERCRNAAGV